MRKLAREISFELIFEILARDESEINTLSLDTLCDEENALPEEDKQFVTTVVNTFVCNKDEILQLIYSHVKDFEPQRIYKVDLALIALGITEINYVKQVEYKIVINEVVELAKKFSTENSPKFINGVLSKISRGE